MLAETLVLALAGLLVGAAAVAALPEYFPSPRPLTVLTGAVSALVAGLVTRAALGSEHPALSTGVGVVTAGLLVSVLARPDRVRRGRGGPQGHRPA
ncbi:hypothetical protein LO771_25460 [Streptacidiphilus sp. ASG 303]|uniref:hypothetical protein n=1 Tax=Streptacidiphilus sp. ASG 303 TaxID=2896847 RepID=UPI001E595F14|nr:hypothetical protein [Streptacidiphilus sp. ASG 303]MCD0485645.1 hypothetical protein [Streptacidiphilus sp. ASG 303]